MGTVTVDLGAKALKIVSDSDASNAVLIPKLMVEKVSTGFKTKDGLPDFYIKIGDGDCEETIWLRNVSSPGTWDNDAAGLAVAVAAIVAWLP